MSSNGVFVFFHMCGELSTGLAHVCIGAVRAWDMEYLTNEANAQTTTLKYMPGEKEDYRDCAVRLMLDIRFNALDCLQDKFLNKSCWRPD